MKTVIRMLFVFYKERLIMMWNDEIQNVLSNITNNDNNENRLTAMLTDWWLVPWGTFVQAVHVVSVFMKCDIIIVFKKRRFLMLWSGSGRP